MVCGEENVSEVLNATAPAALLELEEMARVAKHVFMEIAIPVVCSFGLMGNVLNLIVLTREKRHRTLTKMELSAHIGLIALAFSDLVFCLLALLFTLLPLKGQYRPGNLAIYYEWLGGGFITIFIVTSTWLIVIMAGERYIAVCHPFRARKLISLRRTRCSISAIFVLCTLCTVPIFLERMIVAEECSSGEVFYKIKPRWENERQVVAVRRMVWSVLFDFIPCAALIYFNTCLIWKIHRAKKLRRNMAPMQSSGEHVALRQETNGFSKAGGHHHRRYASEAGGGGGKENGRGSTLGGEESSSNAYGHHQLHPNHQQQQQHDLHSNQPSNNQQQQRGTLVTYKTRSPNTRGHFSVKRKPTDGALNSVTATLVSVVILFLILVSPSELIKFTLYYTSNSKEDEIRYSIFTMVTNFMQALNFSTNFVLYCAINKSFRETLGTVFCWWKARLLRRGNSSGRKKANF